MEKTELNKIQRDFLREIYRRERNRKIQRAKIAFGRSFEYRVKKKLEDDGYVVFRLAGSKPVDLIAIKPDTREILLVECKTNKYYPKRQMKSQVQLAKKLNAKLILAVKGKNFTQIYP